ncbi:MAG: regulatory protein RecX [Phycisphaerales bacterium]|nr:regulatory protein RecX [Phycisphaerales bacterium]
MTSPNTPSRPDPQQLRTWALDWLHRTDRSRQHIQNRLLERGGDPDHVQSLLDEFQQRGWIDDQRCAEALATRWCRSGSLAPDALALRLQEEGIDSHIARTVAGCDEGPAPVELAMDLAQRRLAGLASKPPEVIIRRLQGVLARKGYDEEVVLEVLERLDLLHR